MTGIERNDPPELRGYILPEAQLPRSAAAFADRAAERYGDQIAQTVVLPNGLSAHLTFAELHAHAGAFAHWLVAKSGLAEGEVVAVQIPNSLHYPISVLGAWKAGMIVTNVNPLYTERELRHQLQDSGAKLLITHPQGLPLAHRLAAELGLRVVVAGLWEFFSPDASATIRKALLDDSGTEIEMLLTKYQGFEAILTDRGNNGEDPDRHHPIALYQYTGGTTGGAKGAVLSHRNLVATLQISDDYLKAHGMGLGADDVVLTALPLYHIFAFQLNMMHALRNGARNVMIPQPRPASNLRPAFDQFAITMMTGVDTLLGKLLDESWFRENPPKLRYALSGGMSLRSATANLWREIVGPVSEGYGMTESSCVIAFNPIGEQFLAGSVGLPLPAIEVRVVGPDNELLGSDMPGELQVRGPNILGSYLNQPEMSRLAFVDGWFRTGDIVTIDQRGRITIVDRQKDVVNVSGFNVYPHEVEEHLLAHPDIAEVAVIGLPSDDTGEAVCACVIRSRPDLSAEEVIAFARTSLTGYKVPRTVRFLEELPKSPVGKVLKKNLR